MYKRQFTIILGLSFAVAASLYPAFYITSFSPALALKGSFASSAKAVSYTHLIPEIEAGGKGYLFGQPIETIVGDGKNPTLSAPSVSIRLSSMNKGTLDVFGFELTEGSWDNYVGVWDYAFSESAARKYGVGVGEMCIRDSCKPTSKYRNTRPLALDANDPLRASAGEKDVM